MKGNNRATKPIEGKNDLPERERPFDLKRFIESAEKISKRFDDDDLGYERK